GAAPEWSGPAGCAARFRPLMGMLADAVLAAFEGAVPGCAEQDKLADIAAAFTNIAGLDERAARLRAVAQSVHAA
ncbi:hypothetical protein ACFQX4_03360, partial [Roseomonas sp. GCM10028921]